MEDYLIKFKKNNLKITPKRKAILKIFLDKGKYLSPEQIFLELKKIFNKVSLPSVYRNLETMNSIDVLLKLQKADRRLYYGLCKVKTNEHHHHIFCIKCGKIGEYFACNTYDKMEVNGFQIVSHFLSFEGICPECKDKNVKIKVTEKFQ